MQSTEQDNDKTTAVIVVNGQEPTTEEVFYSDLGDELFKRNIPFLNDVLRQLMTLSVGLMGGGMFFLTDAVCDKGMRLVAMGMFFISLGISLIGILPYGHAVHLGMPVEIRESVNRAIWWKTGWVWGSTVFLVLGLGLAFIGLLLKASSQT